MFKSLALGDLDLYSSVDLYLRIQLVVFSNSLGVMMFVSDATEAAQYALLGQDKSQVWASAKACPTLIGLVYFWSLSTPNTTAKSS